MWYILLIITVAISSSYLSHAFTQSCVLTSYPEVTNFILHDGGRVSDAAIVIRSEKREIQTLDAHCNCLIVDRTWSQTILPCGLIPSDPQVLNNLSNVLVIMDQANINITNRLSSQSLAENTWLITLELA